MKIPLKILRFDAQTISKNMHPDLIRLMNSLGKEHEPFLFILPFEGEEGLVKPLNSVNPREILYQIGSFSNTSVQQDETKRVEFSKYPVGFKDYKKAFDEVMHQIHYGNSYLLNLTFATPITTNLSLEEIFHASHSLYRICLPCEMVCFSPESFVRIQQGKIFSYPMKGTMDASLPDAEKKILENPKELAEHNTIVDLIRNDLSQVAKKVRVNRFRYIDRIETNQKTLLQVSSEICGELPHDYPEHIGDILDSLLPAGSVTGAPKKRTVEIIKHAESSSRGFYTGIAGIFDGQNLNSFVLIRFIEQKGKSLVFRSGGGITFMSNAREEYQEMIDKVYLPFIQRM